MTKEEAREMLNEYYGKFPKMTFPIKEETVASGFRQLDSGGVKYFQYSFTYLIKIAYDLKDNETKEV